MKEKATIVLIDDDDELVDVLSVVLESEGYQVCSTYKKNEALDWIQSRSIDLVLLDLRLGEDNGLDLIPLIREIDPELPIFMITAHGDVDSAVKAFTLGVNGYFQKPFGDAEWKIKIANSIQSYKLKKEIRQLKFSYHTKELKSRIPFVDPMMERVAKRIGIASQVSSTVMITGESGTGKELVARALHYCGVRSKGPFIAFNCAALPENLLESELFGYVKGAFTDAKENKPGLFVKANSGTLFLDEIGDAPHSIQTKLLRVLQEKEVLPLGSTTPIKIDVRVVAATHKSLMKEVEEGRFRQDLYYRLHVFPIQVPPLRERKQDILFLANLFAKKFAEELGYFFGGFSLSAEKYLESYEWPGNVRELQNKLEQATILARGEKMTTEHLFPEIEIPLEVDLNSEDLALEAKPNSSDVPTFFEAKNSFERTYLERVLSVAKGNIARAAKLASKSRTEVYHLLKKHRLDAGSFKDSRNKK